MIDVNFGVNVYPELKKPERPKLNLCPCALPAGPNLEDSPYLMLVFYDLSHGRASPCSFI